MNRLVSVAAAMVWWVGLMARAEDGGSRFFPSFADEQTVGLWLFDDKEYPYVTLTDASDNQYDLRLMEGGCLVAGRFGNALQVLLPGQKRPDTLYERSINPSTLGMAVAYHSQPGGHHAALSPPTSTPKELLATLKDRDWTWECWLKFQAPSASAEVLIDLGQGLEPGFRIELNAAKDAFAIGNAYAGIRATCPTRRSRLTNGKWHHVTFVWNKAEGRLSHFLDGRRQREASLTTSVNTKEEIPGPPEPWREVMRGRFNVAVGHDRNSRNHCTALFDELRLSNVARYSDNFKPPASFSRNYGSAPPPKAEPSGPPLLAAHKSGPFPIGSRKHLFIDDFLIDSIQDVVLTVNPPGQPAQLQVGGDSVFDKDGRVCMVGPDQYVDGGRSHVFLSDDGVNFRKPELGVIRNVPSSQIRVPAFGSVFEDGNPKAGPEERYKLTANVENRGIYLYVSPDGFHWRRNETIMLPLVSGGGCETFWDDQRGLYVNFIKKDSSHRSPEFPRGGRSAPMFLTTEIFKPWPFNVLTKPYFDGWAFPVVTGEAPVPIDKNEYGQVYRTRAIKYPWAPDVYLAFVWRLNKAEERRTDLGVSRDGVHWHFFADRQWYLDNGGEFVGKPIVEALSIYGLIRRGDQIWQYVTYGSTPHSSGDRTARLIQRLDGFVSLDAGDKPGHLVTKPLVFAGDKLVLNINSQSEARVGILDKDGKPIRGFATADCDVIQGDFVHRVVTWNGKSNVGALAGKVVRLRVELQNTKLYAFQFQ